MKGITCAFEKITPAAAKAILINNPNNRRISKSHVAVLAREMASGEWQVTGQGITISNKDRLLDGQHRLFAILESGKTVEMLVTRGIKDKAMDVIDTASKPRSPSDIFAMRGYANAITVAAAINVINGFSYRGRYGTLNYGERRLTQGQYDNYYKTFPAIQHWADEAQKYTNASSRHNKTVLPGSVVAGLGFILGQAEPKEGMARLFMERIMIGEMLSMDDPEFMLRQTLISYIGDAERRLRRDTILWYTIKTWNAKVEDRVLQRLSIGGNEQMPKVIGFDPTILPYFVDKIGSQKVGLLKTTRTKQGKGHLVSKVEKVREATA